MARGGTYGMPAILAAFSMSAGSTLREERHAFR
jgi:hypothetical protein